MKKCGNYNKKKKRQKKEGKLIVGVVYRYLNKITNKSYVGQTINEETRKREFNSKGSYAGNKIDKAREKYGVSDEIWSYEVLFRYCRRSVRKVKTKLNKKEKFYIKRFDSIKNGYNVLAGGSAFITKKRKDAIKGPFMSFDEHGNFVAEFKSLSEISKKLHIRDTGHIVSCIKGKGMTSGGYRWLTKNMVEAEGIDHLEELEINPVNKYDKEGRYLCTYKSSIDAETDTGVYRKNIQWSAHMASKGLWRLGGDFIWGYKKDFQTKNDIIKHYQINISVNQYSRDGKYIKTFLTVSKASKETGISTSRINYACQDKTSTAGGYVWRRWTGDNNDISLSKNSNISMYTKVNQYSLDGKYIRTFDSIKEACEQCNANKNGIFLCIKGIDKISGGYQWKEYCGDTHDIIPIIDMESSGKKVIMFDKNKEFIKEFNSTKEASLSLGFNRGAVSCALKRHYPDFAFCGGYYWKYKNA